MQYNASNLKFVDVFDKAWTAGSIVLLLSLKVVSSITPLVPSGKTFKAVRQLAVFGA